MFAILNEVNISLQGLNVHIIKIKEKINALILKLNMWSSYVKENDVQCFAKLNSFLMENELNLDDSVKNYIMEHLFQLKKTIREYFPEEETKYDWIKNPFEYYDKSEGLPMKEREQLIDISTDSTLKSKFKQVQLLNFWLQIHAEYPEVSHTAINILMPFGTTYLSEKSFSTYVATKTKYRNKLNAEYEMRLQITSIELDFDSLCKKMQAHPSH